MEEHKAQKIALYARVSTLLGQDPENQLIHLRKFAANRGFIVVGEYVDKGISGIKDRRPALDEMIKRARRGEFQLIGVAALDRLGRNTKHLLIMIDELRHFNVAIISLREGIDFASPIGEATLTIISAISQLERNLISERIKNALAAKKMAAQQTGSDWRCGRESVITPDLISKVHELRRQGISIRMIAKQLGVGKSTVQRILAVPNTPKISSDMGDL